MTKYRCEEFTWQEIREIVKTQPVVVLPVGTIEQHGPRALWHIGIICLHTSLSISPSWSSCIGAAPIWAVAWIGLLAAAFWRPNENIRYSSLLCPAIAS
jgi:creatinine amidohydrolase